MKTKTTSISRNAAGIAALLLLSLSSGAQNTASYDMNSSTPPVSGPENVAVGVAALGSNSGGGDNVALGYLCMKSNVNGSANTAAGYATLYGNDGGGNSGFGTKALDQNQTGNNNSGFGVKALTSNKSGDYNSGLGVYADVSANNLTNATAIGANAVVNANDRVWLGDAASTVWTSNYYTTSDGRFKKNVDATKVKGLDFIKLLRPVVYNFDGRAFTEYVTKNMSPEAQKAHLARDFSKRYNAPETGFIAQEVEQAAKTAGYNFSGVHSPEGETDTYGISYYQFVVPLVKAVQEQQQMIDDQKTMNQQLQQQITELQAALGKSSSATGISQQNDLASFSMLQNEPNPFTHETVIKYNLSEKVNNAYLTVYDLSGKQISSFPITQKGNSAITLTSEKLAPGIYLYSIVADGKIMDSKRMIVADK